MNRMNLFRNFGWRHLYANPFNLIWHLNKSFVFLLFVLSLLCCNTTWTKYHQSSIFMPRKLKTIILNKSVNNATNWTWKANPTCLTAKFCYPLEPLHYNNIFFHIYFYLIFFPFHFFSWIKPVVESVSCKVYQE